MKQNGVVLIITLILLIALSVLVLASLTIGRMEIQMSNNAADNLQEFQAAEAGLRAGENNVIHPEDKKEFNYFGVKVRYDVEKFPGSICFETIDHKTWQREFYRITSEAYWPDQQPTILQSIYAITVESVCEPSKIVNENELKVKRIAWCQKE